ncbi:MAG: hypothetical protein KBT03_09580 [Bacteroidales bacterium]|nr:hypothetical protein [Candidatus Scybalousia scybalohippi]
MTLPNGYRQLLWIQSDGNQYINTGIIPTTYTETFIDFLLPSIPSNLTIFGGTDLYGKNDATYAILRKEANESRYNFRMHYLGIIYCTLEVNKRYKVVMNEVGTRNLTLDGNIIGTFDNAINVNIPIHIFMRNSDGVTYYDNNIVRIYAIRFKDNNGILKDFVPCCRESDNSIGLYDKQNDLFYPNEGTGTFTYSEMPTLQQVMPCRVIIDSSASRLPAGYQEVEWIGSTGTQYINTGLSLPDGFKSESEVMIISYGGSGDWLPGRFIGSHNGSAPYNRNHHSFVQPNGSLSDVRAEPASGGVGYYMSNQQLTKDVFFKYEVDNTTTVPTCKVNGVSLTLSNQGGTTGAGNRATYSIYLMAANQAGTAYCSTHLKNKYTKIWDKNDVLLRYYVPCYRTSDNKTGFYDLENGVFYPNKGTGEFDIGSPVGAKVLKQVMPCITIIQGSRLPIGYQEVEYLQSTGTQYIDTGLSLVNGYRTTANVSVIDGSVSGTIIGSSTHTSVWGDRNYVVSSSNGQWLVGYGGTGYQYFGSYSTNTVYEIDFCNIHNRESLKVNNTSYSIVTTGTPGTFYSGNLYMFANNGSGTAELFSGLKIYNLKVYNENDVLVRDFIPAKRNDGELGMYDLVGNVFYINKGTGKFLSGNVIGVKVLKPLTMFRIKEV